jgi:hypothetical protein
MVRVVLFCLELLRRVGGAKKRGARYQQCKKFLGTPLQLKVILK